MARTQTVYLAGPDPWVPDADAVLARKRRLVAAAGLEVLYGRPAAEVGAERDEASARRIYADALQRLRQADVIIANLTPWRGVGCEPGAAFEAGFAAALGKPIFAYMNVRSDQEAELLGRIDRHGGAQLGPDGRWRDFEGAEIEDFGLPETVLLWAQARRFFVIVTDEPLSDCSGLDLCLRALRLYDA